MSRITDNPASGFTFANSITTPDEARAAVEHLERRFTRPCEHCDSGIQYEGASSVDSTYWEVCSACSGTGRRWAK